MRKIAAIALMLFVGAALAHGQSAAGFEPLMDWGHWRLGQKADLEFLKKNNMTITFGNGAPNFETVSRAEFDQQMAEAKEFNKKYHDLGYTVLRYLSTSLNGRTATPEDKPQKDQLHMLKFYNEVWQDYADYIGPKPPPQDNPMTWITVHADGDFPFYRYSPYGEKVRPGIRDLGLPGQSLLRAHDGRPGARSGRNRHRWHLCRLDPDRRGHLLLRLYAQMFHRLFEKESASEGWRKEIRYRGNYVIALPKKRGEKFWMEWVIFRGQSVADFHGRLLAAARQVNPHFQIAGNVYGGFGYGPIAYDAAGNFEMLGETDTFLYSEMQEYLDSAPRKNEQGVKITNSPALKFLAAASHGKPAIIYATEITPPIFPNPTDQALSAMAQINIAEAAANHCIFREKRLTPDGATQMYDFMARNESSLLGCQLRSNVAVLASLNQYLADELSFAFVSSRVLADRGIAHDLIVEKDLLDGTLARYDLVLVPYMPLLSLEKQQALVEYAKKGGIVLVLGESGRKDQFGLEQPQNAFLTALKARVWPVDYIEKKAGKGRLVFMPLPIPADRYLVPAKEKSEYTTFGPSMADVFADIPEAYTRGRFNLPLLEKLTMAVDKMEGLLGNKMTRLLQKTPYVEITTMLKPDSQAMLVHLVNYDVTIDGVITPAKDLSVQVALPRGMRASRISYCGNLAAMQPAAFQAGKVGPGVITFSAPELQVYGLAVIELAKK